MLGVLLPVDKSRKAVYNKNVGLIIAKVIMRYDKLLFRELDTRNIIFGGYDGNYREN